jgi:predicted TIM-barrel fold metal-dependent hydrolase
VSDPLNPTAIELFCVAGKPDEGWRPDTMTEDTRRSRRLFLATLGAAGAGTLLGGVTSAQTPTATARRIDIHQHFVSPGFYATLNAKNAASPVPGLAAWKGYSPASAVEALDRVGIGTAMLSITAPGVWFGDAQEARKLAREMNEYAASKLVSDYKGRFGLFAVLPLPDVEGSLEEIEYAFDTLKADGVGLLTSYGTAWLGDPSFAPVLSELNRRKAVVYTHPTDAACCQNLIPRVANQMLEYPMDTTRTIASLIVSETATKCPDVRFIFSHAGGTLIGVAGRLLGAEMTADNLAKPAAANSRLHHLRRFYYDTAGSANPVNMQALKTLVGTSQIVFGTDAPFFDGAPQVQGLQRAGFSADELRAIERDNALRIIPRLAS